jgi:DNA polymerase
MPQPSGAVISLRGVLPLAVPEVDDARAATLAAVVGEVRACTRCRLHASRIQGVPGEGDPNARLMLVGEAPGAEEDRTGRPFVGRAGQLLTELLGEVGLPRASVFIANVLKSRPPGNRNPEPDEIAACSPYLLRQISAIRPLMIGTLGAFASRLILDTREPMGELRGRPRRTRFGGLDLVVYPMFHPAAALRATSMMDALREDVRRLPALLDELDPPEPVFG